MKGILGACAVLLCAGTARADTLLVPKDFDTIQEAVDNAQAGDTIVVSKGVYRENVTANLDGLRFLGKKAVWDGHVGGSYGDCLNATGNGILVQGFAFRNGASQLVIAGDDALVQKCTFTGAYSTSLSVNGNGALVQKCVFRGGEDALTINGSDAVVQKNVASRYDEGLFYFYGGDRAQVLKNRLGFCDDDHSVEISGDEAWVYGNAISNGSSTGVYVSGTGGVVERNTIRRGESGVTVYGSNHQVLSNRIELTDGTGIYVYGSGNSVEGNGLRWLDGSGIYGYGDQNTVGGNDVLLANGTGIYFSGRNNVIDGNFIGGAFSTGIETQYGGNSITGNTVMDAGSYGIYSTDSGDATSTTVSGNRIAGFDNWGIYSYTYGSPFDVQDNEVSDGNGGAGGIYVYSDFSGGGTASGNEVSDVGGDGIYVYAYNANGVTIGGNTVEGAGSGFDWGIYVYSSAATVADNTVVEAFWGGFCISGDDMAVTGNLADGCTTVGFANFGNRNSFADNSGFDSGGEGFVNFGYDTVFTDNTFLGNRLDVANGGGYDFDIFSGNTFDTGGETTPPEVYND